MTSVEWERHRPTIEYLYSFEGLRLQDVISHMAEKYSFVQEKKQYEYRLRKWKIKKNRSKEFWKYIDHQLRKRKGKRTEITIYGTTLSEDKIRRETNRYVGIPNINEIGRSAPSPVAPEEDIICVRSPGPIEVELVWPSTLPWLRFDFMNRILPTLRKPAALLRTFFSLVGSDECFLEFTNANNPIVSLARNPLELHVILVRLNSMLPDSPVFDHQQPGAIIHSDASLYRASQILRAIFYRLSNRLDEFEFESYEAQRIYDQFVLRLVAAVSRTNRELMSTILFGNCATTQSIKEAVYGCAVRDKNYDIISQLIQSGVSPDLCIGLGDGQLMEVRINSGEDRCEIIQGTCSEFNGLGQAAFTHDIYLAKLLLRAGANANHAALDGSSPLMITAYASGPSDKATEALHFAQLLVQHGAVVDAPSELCFGIPMRVPSPLWIAIARGSNQLARFLVDNGTGTGLARLGGIFRRLKPRHNEWLVFGSTSLGEEFIRGYSPLQLACLLGNHEMIELLLPPIVARPLHPRATCIAGRFLIISCWAGDVTTALKLLDLNLDLTLGWEPEQEPDLSPLVATSWNPNTEIAERLLQLGAHVGPSQTDGILQTSTPCPIQVAASHGITDLVRQLIDRGADCNVGLDNAYLLKNKYCWLLLAESFSTPLYAAIKNGHADTARVLLPCSNLVGGELVEAIRRRDNRLADELISRGSTIFDIGRDGRTVLDAAAEGGDREMALHYFASGGSYTSLAFLLAAKVALKSKDYSIVKLLLSKRSSGVIDSFEASCLVLSIQDHAWDLFHLLLGDSFLPGETQSLCHEAHWLEYPSKPNTVALCEQCMARAQSFSNISPSFSSPCEVQELTPLMGALHLRNMIAVEAIIQRGYPIQYNEMNKMMTVLRAPNSIPNIIKSAVQPRHDMSLLCRHLLLHHAIYCNDLERVHNCISVIDSLNYSEEDLALHRNITKRAFVRASPLVFAARTGTIKVTRLLLNAGADVNWQTCGDERAIEAAARHKRTNLVQFLLEHGAVVNPPAQLKKGATALQYAAIYGDLQLARFLVDRGADINALPGIQWGRTALEGAAEYGRLDVARFLLERGANLKGGMREQLVRSIFFARSRGHSALADHIMQCERWTESDQILYDNTERLYDLQYFSRGKTETGRFKDLRNPIHTFDDPEDFWPMDTIEDDSLEDSSIRSHDEASLVQATINESADVNDISDQPPYASPEQHSPQYTKLGDISRARSKSDGTESGHEKLPVNDVASLRAEATRRYAKELGDDLDEDITDRMADFEPTSAIGSAVGDYEDDQTVALEVWQQEMAIRGIEVPETDLAYTNTTPCIPLATQWQGPFWGAAEVSDLNDI
ncbi:hypothetical protein F4777DRAFT_560499 [Nemania sp. FL0916]|nr:hypothetical protein F4777DRAFT_560499 [Nemania sp. FL0916]